MTHKRAFREDTSLEVVCKYPRQLEHPSWIGPIVPSSNIHHEGQATGENFYNKCHDVGNPATAPVATIANGRQNDFENRLSPRISHLYLVNSRVMETDIKLDVAHRLSLFPEFFDHGQQMRALFQADEILPSVLEHHPPQISVGPDFQAYVPEWGAESLVIQNDDNDEKLMGTCIISMPELESSEILCPEYNGARKSCRCTDIGSIRCVKLHIAEARQKLLENLGPATFQELGFCDMGEEVASKWADEEEDKFHDVILSNPESHGKHFWENLLDVFPFRAKRELVSYYYNVFKLQKRSEQNRFDPQNINSDNDEWQRTGESDEDEDSVMESPNVEDSTYSWDHVEDWHENVENECGNVKNREYQGDTDDVSGSYTKMVKVYDVDDGDHSCWHFGNFESRRRDNFDVEDDLFTSFDNQQHTGADVKQFKQE